MLEQAIADAATLREQAIKNAENSVIEKYSRQIKEAVDKMLDSDDPLTRAEDTLNEIEDEREAAALDLGADLGGEDQGTEIEATPAWDPRYDDIVTNFSTMIDGLPEDSDGNIELDLGDFDLSPEEAAELEDTSDAAMEVQDSMLPPEDSGDELPPMGEEGEEDMDLDAMLGELQEDLSEEDKEDKDLQEILNMLEEQVEIGYDPINDEKGKWANNSSRKEFNQEMTKLIHGEDSEFEEEPEESDESDEDQLGKLNDLHETIENLTDQNQEMGSVLTKLEIFLEETLLSNAKFLYQNRTLSDASLNERQKSKIVEAITNAESTKEAKTLFETLKATVGATSRKKSQGPQSLSETVNRRNNLSTLVSSRQNIKESKSMDKSKEKTLRLAGIIK